MSRPRASTPISISVQTACANTRLGSHPLGEWLRSGGDDSDSDYVFWLDQTSRLYYQRISVPQYRSSIAGAMGGDKANAAALDCIVRHLAGGPSHQGARRAAVVKKARCANGQGWIRSIPGGRDNGRRRRSDGSGRLRKGLPP